jgi:MscS family membrane protein
MNILLLRMNGRWSLRNVKWLLATVFVAVLFCILVPPPCVAAKGSPGLGLFAEGSQPGEAPTKVEVRVEKGAETASKGDKDQATPKLKIEIESKQPQANEGEKKQPKPMTILPSPEQAIAPVETEKIDEAAQRVTRKIDEIGWSTSRYLGDWMNAGIVYGITWFKLAFCFVLLLVVAIVRRLCETFIEWRLKRVAGNGRPAAWKLIVLQALRRPLGLFVWVYGLYAALALLLVHLDHPWEPNTVLQAGRKIADVGGTVALFWFIYSLVLETDKHLRKLAMSADSKVDILMAGIIGRTIRICIIIVAGILIVQNMTGIAAGPLLASFGLGGLAVALAAKESLTNLFGTLTILLEKPFVIGDRVKIEGYDGMVESLGYRSTRLRTWDGHLVSIPNQKLMGSNFENVSKRPHIRWQTDIGITYDTTPEKVQRAVTVIKEILDHHDGMDELWPPWVHFTGLDDWCLKISVMAWYGPPDLRQYREWVQKTCLEIMRRFEAEGISFAFPTQTLVLTNDPQRNLTFQAAGKDAPLSADGGTKEA